MHGSETVENPSQPRTGREERAPTFRYNTLLRSLPRGLPDAENLRDFAAERSGTLCAFMDILFGNALYDIGV